MKRDLEITLSLRCSDSETHMRVIPVSL